MVKENAIDHLSSVECILAFMWMLTETDYPPKHPNGTITPPTPQKNDQEQPKKRTVTGVHLNPNLIHCLIGYCLYIFNR